MATLTANDYAQQMVAQARVRDPSFSGEVGTPERQIIDTVAQALAENQIDFTALSGALDIDSKYGSNLDQFTMLFGMQRQQAVAATGFVVFSRNTPIGVQTTIPIGTTLQANNQSLGSVVQYTTTASGYIAANSTSSVYIPVQAVTTGTSGNCPANSITMMVGAPVPGVTSVTNPAPLTNGVSVEDDNSFKVRFKNTWARNLAGTKDQYLALALAGAFTSKANVVGLQSRYQEYIQVPSYDDAGYANTVQTTAQNTYGIQNQWTSGQSTIPYAKQIFSNTQNFVSNGQQATTAYFYIPGVDYQFNATPIIAGDTLRNQTSTALSGSVTLPTATITVTSTNGFTPSGSIFIAGNTVTYTGKTSTTFTGCTGGSGSVASGTLIYQLPSGTQPNFTFLNVYNPVAGTTPIAGLQSLSPGNIVLAEFSYVSNSSRNDLVHNITNAVDVYVDGTNPVQASCTVQPVANASTMFSNQPTSPWYYENYRRDGSPIKRPQIGNYITPLYQTPLTALPGSIVIGATTFNLNTDYWLVHETDSIGGSIRARDGIEWNVNTAGTTLFNASAANNPLQVTNYQFDSNIATLQASMESARQITTDVLVHAAKPRYFKLDITAMYTSNANYAAVNSAVSQSIQAYFTRQYFGAVVQLSTLLEVIHEVQGIQNVRWSNDVSLIPNLMRVIECDVNGNPLHGVSADRLVYGTGSSAEQQTLYIVGAPFSQSSTGVLDNFTLAWYSGNTLQYQTSSIPLIHSDGSSTTASEIQSAVRTGTGSMSGNALFTGATVTLDSRPTTGVTAPITSFTLTYGANGVMTVPLVTQQISASSYAYDTDFFLQDSELPFLPTRALSTDTVPGIIVRPRAQNTFFRPGLS